MPQWLDEINQAGNDIVDAAYAIDSIAIAAERLGLNVADELHEISRGLLAAQEKVRRAVGKECADSARRAEDASRTMLKAALAGVTHSATSR